MKYRDVVGLKRQISSVSLIGKQLGNISFELGLFLRRVLIWDGHEHK